MLAMQMYTFSGKRSHTSLVQICKPSEKEPYLRGAVHFPLQGHLRTRLSALRGTVPKGWFRMTGRQSFSHGKCIIRFRTTYCRQECRTNGEIRLHGLSMTTRHSFLFDNDVKPNAMNQENNNITFVSRKPSKCPHCGGKVVLIIYGEPSTECFEMFERGDIVLGGCCITEGMPDWQCRECGHQFIKGRPDDITMR